MPGRHGPAVRPHAAGAVDAGGALDGLGLALWARRLGWAYVVVWSLLLFLWFGGPAIQLFYDLLHHLL